MRAMQLLQVFLHHAVQLQPLPAGDAERGVAQLVAEVDLGQQLVGGQLPAGNAGADHEHVRLAGLSLHPIGPGGAAGVAVVLLVGAVELEQLATVLAEVIVLVDELLADHAAKVVAFELDGLQGTQLFGAIGHRLLRPAARWKSRALTHAGGMAATVAATQD